MDKKERRREANRKTELRPERRAQHNEYNRTHYDRLQLALPPGTKDRIKAAGIESMNGYIRDLIMADLERRESEGEINEKYYAYNYNRVEDVKPSECYMGGKNCGTCAYCRDRDSKWNYFENRYCICSTKND